MSQLTNPLFESEFELFKQSSYYAQLVDEGSEWHPEVRAIILAAFVDLIQQSTNEGGPYVPEISRFCYFAINQRADLSEVHVSLYTDLLPEHLSVDHNPRKLFVAMNMKTEAILPLANVLWQSSEYLKACELPDLLAAHAFSYPPYLHPVDSMPKGMLKFLADEGFCLKGHCIDWEDHSNPANLRGPMTMLLSRSQGNKKYNHISFTYDHKVFIEDYQWIANNAPNPEEKHGQET